MNDTLYKAAQVYVVVGSLEMLFTTKHSALLSWTVTIGEATIMLYIMLKYIVPITQTFLIEILQDGDLM